MKRNILLLLIAVFLIPFVASGNTAYKALGNGSLYDLNSSKGPLKKIGEVAKGDTVYATELTYAYLAEHAGERIQRVPVEYKGQPGLINFSFYYPVKTTPTEKLVYVNDSSPKASDPLQRFLQPLMSWAMNIYSGPIGWLYGILISAGLAIVMWFVCMKVPNPFVLAGLGITLMAMSVCEVMYALSFHNMFLWFIKPDIVGWGYTILNFFLLAIIAGIQTYGLYYLWTSALKTDGETTPKWIKDISFLPILLGIALIIMMWIDKGDMPGRPYAIAMCSLAIPSICGMGWMFMQKRFIAGIVFPIIYLVTSVGLTMTIMIAGVTIILVSIVIVLIGIGLSFAFGALSAIFGGEQVTVYTNDGRTVRGTKNLDGTVTGSDGKRYHVK